MADRRTSTIGIVAVSVGLTVLIGIFMLVMIVSLYSQRGVSTGWTRNQRTELVSVRSGEGQEPHVQVRGGSPRPPYNAGAFQPPKGQFYRHSSKLWGESGQPRLAKLCNFTSSMPEQIPIPVGVNTMALLEKLIILNRYMMGPDSPRWYVTAGTLLSAWRHGAVMPWDIDADIVAEDADSFVQTLVAKLNGDGLGSRWVLERKMDGVYQFRSAAPCIVPHRTPYHLDIHPLWMYLDRINFKSLRDVPVFRLLEGVCQCPINNVLLPCPGDLGTPQLLQGLFTKPRVIDAMKYESVANRTQQELVDCLYKAWDPNPSTAAAPLRISHQRFRYGPRAG